MSDEWFQAREEKQLDCSKFLHNSLFVGEVYRRKKMMKVSDNGMENHFHLAIVASEHEEGTHIMRKWHKFMQPPGMGNSSASRARENSSLILRICTDDLVPGQAEHRVCQIYFAVRSPCQINPSLTS